MAEFIKIFNPKEKPYGPLSNNSTHQFELDGEKWKTVTHYVYSNLLHFTLFKTMIRNQAGVKDIYPLFLNLYSQEIRDITVSAVNEANEVKFSNKDLKDLLLATENYEILYVSDDPILGARVSGDKFVGDNAMGKSLMKIRQRLKFGEKKYRSEAGEAAAEDRIYQIYKAYHVLETYVNQDNSDVLKFMNVPLEEIISSRSGIKFPDKKVVIQLYNRGSFPVVSEEIKSPGNLVPLFRKENIDKIDKKIGLVRQNSIFNLYMNYWLKKKNEEGAEGWKVVPENSFEKFRKEAVSHLGSSQLINLRERVSSLFEKGMLSDSLSDRIDGVLKNLPSPMSKEEIGEVKNFEPVIERKEIGENKNLQNRIVFVQEDISMNPPELQPFSPDYYMNVEIFAHEFPTVSHYILVKLLSILRQFDGLEKAYSAMTVEGPDGIQYRNLYSLREIYDEEKNQEYVASLITYARLGMDKKFSKSRPLQNLLLSTGRAKFLYTSRDPVLGTGSREQKGKNYAGEYLENIRDALAGERAFVEDNLLAVGDVGQIILSDSHLREWMRSRLFELCKTVETARDYFKDKHKFEHKTEVTPNFFLLIIDGFYRSCYDVYDIYKGEIEVPAEFISMMSGCRGFRESEKKELAQAVWKYFVSIFYAMIEVSKKPTQVQLRKILSYSQLKMSKEKTCKKLIEDKKINCVLEAMLNILSRLKEFSLKYVPRFDISPADITAAMEILLNQSPGLPAELPGAEFSSVEIALAADALRKIDPSTNEATARYLLGMSKFISELRSVDKTTRQNRVNFFAESSSAPVPA